MQANILLDRRGPLVVLLVSTVLGVIWLIYIYDSDDLVLLYYSDSISHLIRARQLVDSESPGIEQIGTVWLPLPHLVLLPFSLVDPLFRTGLAGTFVSLPSIVITSMIVYKILRQQTSKSWIAVLGANLFFMNPNILYLGVTAMTEGFFMLLFIASSYYFQNYIGSLPLHSKSHLGNASKIKNHTNWLIEANETISPHDSIVSKNLIRCSCLIALAGLCRYEAWPLAVFLTSFTALYFVRTRMINKKPRSSRVYKKRLLGVLICLFLSFSGIFLWISYNWVFYGNPFEFLVSHHYSAAAQSLLGQNREHLFLQPLNAASTYGITALVFFGPLTIAGAALGYIVHKKSAICKKEALNRDMLCLFLAIPPLVLFTALVVGIGEMNSAWFNSRFSILLSPLLIILFSYTANGILEVRTDNNKFASVLVVVFLICPIITLPLSGGIVTMIDAKNSESYGTRPSGEDVGKALRILYDQGKILLITGSAQQNIVMHASGIPLKNFKAALEGSSIHFDLHSTIKESNYVVLSKKPDSSSEKYAESWLEGQNGDKRQFRKAYENLYYLLFVRNNLNR